MRSQPSINALRRQNLIVINLKIKEEMRKVLTTKNTTIKEFLAQFSTVDQERVLKFVAIIGITELYRERKDATGKEKRSFTLGEVVLLLKDERGQKTSTRIVAEPPRAVHRAEVEEPRKTRLPSTVTDRGAWVSGIEASGGRCLGDPRESSASRNNLLEIADSFLNSPLMQHLQNMSMTAPQARDSGNLVRATTILPDTYGGAFPPPKTPGGISLGKAPSPNDRYSKASCDFMEYMRMIGGQAQGRRRDYSNLLTRTGNPEDNMSSTSSNFSVLSFDDDIRGFLQHQFRMKHQIPGSSEQMPDSDAEMPLAPRDSRLPGANELRSSEDMDESSSQLSVQLASGQIPKQAMNLFFTTWDNGNVNN
eukprot:TRINITY_DN1378_c0_g2_i4.p1 TRINITY_DN1378_c0_g2~~TRINITY_DN1378_c0_g2_i4.p1  ORF type:complete len:364 (-),score=66.01 TRINITY_DN1378_c0_g2_i4:30-1121(-)